MQNPKFKKGDIVRYNFTQRKDIIDKRKELLKTYTNQEIGESPTYKILPLRYDLLNCFI